MANRGCFAPGLVESMRVLASTNTSTAAPDSVQNSPRREVTLGRHFVAGVCSTLSQLVAWRPAKCLRSLSKVFLYMKDPGFLVSLQQQRRRLLSAIYRGIT